MAAGEFSWDLDSGVFKALMSGSSNVTATEIRGFMKDLYAL